MEFPEILTWKNTDSTVVVFTLILRLAFVLPIQENESNSRTVHKREDQNTENFELRNLTPYKNL